MSKRTLFLSCILVLLALVLAGCTLGRGGSSRITPTPTKTARSLSTSTMTPTATSSPTGTPLPTETPVPPTETPLPPTDTPPPTEAPTEAPPTSTPEPPTDTPEPAAPTSTPKPKPTNTLAPPTNTPKPQVDFRVVEQRLMSKAENGGPQLHMVLIRVADAAGNALSGVVIWDANHPDAEIVSGTKPEPYHAEYLFWDYDGYQFEIKGAGSEKTKVLSTDVHKIPLEDLVAAGYCIDVTNCNPDDLVQHYSWYVTFQRTW